MLTTFPRRVTKFHSTTKILVQYSPWVSIIAVDVISYSSLSLGVGRFFFLGGGGGRGYMDLAQRQISIVLLLHYSATCFKSCLCCTAESRSAREAGISVIFPWIVAGWDPEWECDCRQTYGCIRHILYKRLVSWSTHAICDRSSGILTAYSN